jgi:hypothetical protein
LRTTKELIDITTSHDSGAEVVEAIFDRPRGKAKWDEDIGKGTSNCSNKKKSKQRHGGSLVAATEQKGGWAPTEGTPDHFEKLLEGPCLIHQAPVQGLCPHEVVFIRWLQEGGPEKKA